MGNITVQDITIHSLKKIEVSGGDVLHGMKQSDPGYAGFGEAYFSWVSKDSVKAWKRHTKMTMNVLVPVGKVRFVFRRVDTDDIEEFRVEEIGEDHYVRLTVPPGIWFGFSGNGYTESLVINISNIPHDPNEVDRLSLSDINYKWS